MSVPSDDDDDDDGDDDGDDGLLADKSASSLSSTSFVPPPDARRRRQVSGTDRVLVLNSVLTNWQLITCINYTTHPRIASDDKSSVVIELRFDTRPFDA